MLQKQEMTSLFASCVRVTRYQEDAKIRADVVHAKQEFASSRIKFKYYTAGRQGRCPWFPEGRHL